MDVAKSRVNAFRSPLDQAISLQTGIVPPAIGIQGSSSMGKADPYLPVFMKQPLAGNLQDPTQATAQENTSSELPVDTKLDRAGASEYVRLLQDGTDPAKARLQALQHQATVQEQTPVEETIAQKPTLTQDLGGALKDSTSGFLDTIGKLGTNTANAFTDSSKKLGADVFNIQNEGILKAPGNILSAGSNFVNAISAPVAGLATTAMQEPLAGTLIESAGDALPAGTKDAFNYLAKAYEGLSPEQKSANKDFLNALNIVGGVAGGVTAGEGANVVGKVLDSSVGKVQRGVESSVAGATDALGSIRRPGFLGGAKEAVEEVPVGIKSTMQSDPLGYLDEPLKVTKEKPGTFQDIAGKISTRANRFIGQKPTEDFVKMTGQTPGEFAVARGMTKTGEGALEEATQNFQKSMKEADDAFALIPDKIRPTGKDVIQPMIDDLAERLVYTDSNDAPRIAALKSKYDSGEGLTMSEINDLKRTYANNFKYTFADNVSKDAVRSKNLQDNLREWQFDEAGKRGLTNIDEINKNTQAWRAFSDGLGRSLSRQLGNNAMGLTDWIALSGGSLANLGLFAGKKLLSSEMVKNKLIKSLSKQTKPAIIKASNIANITPTPTGFTPPPLSQAPETIKVMGNTGMKPATSDRLKEIYKKSQAVKTK